MSGENVRNSGLFAKVTNIANRPRLSKMCRVSRGVRQYYDDERITCGDTNGGHGRSTPTIDEIVPVTMVAGREIRFRPFTYATYVKDPKGYRVRRRYGFAGLHVRHAGYTHKGVVDWKSISGDVSGYGTYVGCGRRKQY